MSRMKTKQSSSLGAWSQHVQRPRRELPTKKLKVYMAGWNTGLQGETWWEKGLERVNVLDMIGILSVVFFNFHSTFTDITSSEPCTTTMS